MGRMDKKSLYPTLKTFFQKYTTKSFRDLQVMDRGESEYISDLLTRFARVEEVYRLRGESGEPLTTVVEMLMDLFEGIEEKGREMTPVDRPEQATEKERDICRHIGDYTLFMTGIFKDYAERMDFYRFYLREGTNSYLSVSEIDRQHARPGAALFRNLSNKFEFFSGALDYMKKVYLRPEGKDTPIGGVLQAFWRG